MEILNWKLEIDNEKRALEKDQFEMDNGKETKGNGVIKKTWNK